MKNKRKVWDNKYYKLHKEECIKRTLEWRSNNKTHILKYQKLWRAERNNDYRIKQNEYKRLWRKLHPEADRANCRRRRAKRLAVNENYTITDAQYTKTLFNNVCVNCGSSDHLTVDHHYPLAHGHALTRQNAVLLCNTCNCSKGDKLPEEFYTKDKLEYITERLTVAS